MTGWVQKKGKIANLDNSLVEGFDGGSWLRFVVGGVCESHFHPGNIRKKWNRFFMALDEESSVLRWWKNDERKSMDSAIYSKLVTSIT